MKKVTKCLIAASIGAAVQSTPVMACDGGGSNFLGQLCPVGFNFAPVGWALAQGQLLSIASNDALFSLLGTNYGGDGRVTFGLPDTRGRAIIGAGNGSTLSNYFIGQKGGVENVTLTVTQMPSHNHSATTTVNATTAVTVSAQVHASSGGANQSSPSGNYLATAPSGNNMYQSYNASSPQVNMQAGSVNFSLAQPLTISTSPSTSVGNSGGNQAHNNRSPYLGIHWIIALQGIYPSRS